MREGMLHIRDVEWPKKTGSMEVRLEAMEQQVFKCPGMVERGINANHMMITEFTNKHKIHANDIGKHLSRLYVRIDHLQAHIYDVQNQNSFESYHRNGEGQSPRSSPGTSSWLEDPSSDAHHGDNTGSSRTRLDYCAESSSDNELDTSSDNDDDDSSPNAKL
ncbi:40S ribosomal protein S5-1 [Hordeum vulgare]|nr:40S ribosomal protein S5-1 [Hordeum vulgare]